MKVARCLLAAACVRSTSAAVATNPITQVLQMISDFQAKVIGEGAQAQKLYEEFSEWCEDRSTALSQDITTGRDEVATLTAAINKEEAVTATLTAKTEELGANLAVDEADLKAARGIRSGEAATFTAEERELMSTVNMLERASRIVESEMNKGGASMMQLGSVTSVTQALSSLVKALELNSADASKLTSLVQAGDVGAPAGAVYSSQSGGILDTLQTLLEEAQTQLEDARKTETSNIHNFEMLQQSIEDEVKYGTKEMAEAKKGLADSAETKSVAEGDLALTSKELKSALQGKSDLHHECMTKAEDFEAETKSRGEELKAMAEAKKAIVETTSGASSINYGLAQETSFLQRVRSELKSGVDVANFEVVRLIRDLARKQQSSALAQLAQRVSSTSGADQFGKIKGLIRDMIEKLETEAEEDATEKAYCDTQLGDTNEKKATKTAEIAKLTTRIDTMSARSAHLKEEVADLQGALAKLAASQSAMDKLRAEEKSAYTSNKADMEKGLEGVKLALKILNEYYASTEKAHDAGLGAGAGIVGLLEVIESDFSKSLAEINSAEDAAVNAYEEQTKANEIEKTTKDQDVKYKSKESKDLDQASAELSSDRSTVQTELDAVLEYLSKIEERCIAKAETFAERAARFAAEIAGLKEALQILESETAFLQRRSVRSLRRA